MSGRVGMGERIAHPDRDACRAALDRFFAALHAALVVAPSLALGVLLLGPHAHYPLHAHPAVEIYYTLTAGDWWREPGPWRSEPVRTAIYHAPNVRHATGAGAVPLLAVYLWRGDLTTHAALV